MPYILPPDEVPIYYEEAGQGKNILLIHGGAANTNFWKKQIPELSRHFRVVAYDLRGHGSSGKIDEGNNLTQYGQDMAHLMETLDMEDVVVVGWSLGTAVLFSYVRQFGVERLAGFVDIDQPAKRFVPEERFRKLTDGIKSHKFRTHRQRILSFFSAPPPEEELYWMTCEMMKTPTGVYLSIIQDSYQTDFEPVLSQVTIPTLNCIPDKNPSDPKLAESMPDARTVVFENSGHLLFWEHPEKFNRFLTDFVEEVTGQPTEARAAGRPQ